MIPRVAILAVVSASVVVAALAVGAWRRWHRVVRGDPLEASCAPSDDGKALVIRARQEGRASPLVLEAVLVDRALVDRLKLSPPKGFREVSESRLNAAQPLSDVVRVASSTDAPMVAYVGHQLVAAGDTGADLRLPVRQPGAAVRGKLVLLYRYESLLSRMSSSVFLDVDSRLP